MEFCITYACAVIIIMLPKTTIIILLPHIRFFYKLMYFYTSLHQYKLGELLLASVWGGGRGVWNKQVGSQKWLPPPNVVVVRLNSDSPVVEA